MSRRGRIKCAKRLSRHDASLFSFLSSSNPSFFPNFANPNCPRASRFHASFASPKCSVDTNSPASPKEPSRRTRAGPRACRPRPRMGQQSFVVVLSLLPPKDSSSSARSACWPRASKERRYPSRGLACASRAAQSPRHPSLGVVPALSGGARQSPRSVFFSFFSEKSKQPPNEIWAQRDAPEPSVNGPTTRGDRER